VPNIAELPWVFPSSLEVLSILHVYDKFAIEKDKAEASTSKAG
jgi:hypothetical protein